MKVDVRTPPPAGAAICGSSVWSRLTNVLMFISSIPALAPRPFGEQFVENRHSPGVDNFYLRGHPARLIQLSSFSYESSQNHFAHTFRTRLTGKRALTKCRKRLNILTRRRLQQRREAWI